MNEWGPPITHSIAWLDPSFDCSPPIWRCPRRLWAQLRSPPPGSCWARPAACGEGERPGCVHPCYWHKLGRKIWKHGNFCQNFCLFTPADTGSGYKTLVTKLSNSLRLFFWRVSPRISVTMIWIEFFSLPHLKLTGIPSLNLLFSLFLDYSQFPVQADPRPARLAPSAGPEVKQLSKPRAQQTIVTRILNSILRRKIMWNTYKTHEMC